MRVTALVNYFGENGKIDCQAQLIAEFDGEFELPGAQETSEAGIVWRAIEVKAMGQSLLAAIGEEFAD